MPLDRNIVDHALPELPSRWIRVVIYGGAICALAFAAYAALISV